MTLHLKKINDFGGKNGGGGGEVTIQIEKHLVNWNNKDLNTGYISSQQTRYAGYLPFNLDENKCICLNVGGSGKIATFGKSGITYIGDISLLNTTPSSYATIANDDSAVIEHYNGTFRYIPINNYVAGQNIDLTPSVVSNYSSPVFINSTTFAILDRTNKKILIIKLENGALSEDKTIVIDDNYTDSPATIQSIEGKIVLLNTGTATNSPSGIRVMDIDTEEIIYEDLRFDSTNRASGGIGVKDNFLFVPLANNSTPYVTKPMDIYEYSNGQFVKRNVVAKGYVATAISIGGGVFVRKQDGIYVVIVKTNAPNYQIIFCDLTKNEIELSYSNGYASPSSSVFPVIADNKMIVGMEMQVRLSSTYYVYRLYYGEYILDKKIATQLEFQGNIFDISQIGE